MVVVLGVRDDLLVRELAHHLGDRSLIVGVGRRGRLVATAMVDAPRLGFGSGPGLGADGGARTRRRDSYRENTGVNFARDVLDHLPPDAACAG